jgi:integrase
LSDPAQVGAPAAIAALIRTRNPAKCYPSVTPERFLVFGDFAKLLRGLVELARIVRVDYWDSSLRGFGIRVTPDGRKTFFVRYRFAGLRRRFVLGSYPSVDLAEARTRAKKALGRVSDGADPLEEKKKKEEEQRQKRQAGISFEELATAYLAEEVVKLRSRYEVERVFKRDIIPVFGKERAVSDDIRPAIQQFVNDIANKQKKPVMANRTLAYIRRMFEWALENNRIKYNPCVSIPRPGKEKQRERVLTETEIVKVWKALDSEGLRSAAILRLILLTDQRPGEVTSMRWQDIDGNWWTIPAEFAKNGLSHRVPLSPQAMGILDQIRKIEADRNEKDGCPWVFPNPKRTDRMYWYQKLVERVRPKSGVDDWRAHDLRRTASSMMTGMGFSRLVAGKILNHREPGVTKVYDRYSYDNDKLEALEAWGNRMEAILSEDKAA